jgi:hypothetical protein
MVALHLRDVLAGEGLNRPERLREAVEAERKKILP